MRILIISHAFPPYNSIGAVRVGKTAKYLDEMGHDVRVITTRQSGPNDLAIEIALDKIVYTPRIDINYPKELLRAKKQNILSIDTPVRRIEKSNFVDSLWKAYRVLINIPDEAVGWIPYALRAASVLVRVWKPDLIFASAMPFTSLIIAKRISKRCGIPWVGELRDLWVDHHNYSYPGARRWLDNYLESKVLSSASALVTVSEPLAAVLRLKYNKPIAVILNGFDFSDYSVPEITGSDKTLRIVYTGSIYKGKMDPSPLFSALQLLGSYTEKVKVEFYGFGRYFFIISQIAEQFGVSHLISVKARLPYTEALLQQKKADVLLLLLWTDLNEQGVYTGKLFEYIGARRPILAIGGINNVAASLITERKAGIVLNDPAQIAEQLKVWIHEKELEGIASTGEQALAGLSRREQTCKLVEFLQSILKSNS